MPVTDLATYFVERHKIEPIILLKESWYANTKEVRVDVRHDPMRWIDDKSKPALVAGELTEVHIPFEGESEPAMADYKRWLGAMKVAPLLVPHDCIDGFLYAYWRRPEAYLDARIRSGSSSFRAIRNADAGLQRLKQDLETGEWKRRYAGLLAQDTYDAGYRLVMAD